MNHCTLRHTYHCTAYEKEAVGEGHEKKVLVLLASDTATYWEWLEGTFAEKAAESTMGGGIVCCLYCCHCEVDWAPESIAYTADVATMT